MQGKAERPDRPKSDDPRRAQPAQEHAKQHRGEFEREPAARGPGEGEAAAVAPPSVDNQAAALAATRARQAQHRQQDDGGAVATAEVVASREFAPAAGDEAGAPPLRPGGWPAAPPQSTLPPALPPGLHNWSALAAAQELDHAPGVRRLARDQLAPRHRQRQ